MRMTKTEYQATYNRIYLETVKVVEGLNKQFIRGLSLMEGEQKEACAMAVRDAFEDYFYVSGK